MPFPSVPAILESRDLRLAPGARVEADDLKRVYAWMFLARLLDNRILELFRQGLIKGTVTGGQGNEGLVVPLALLADKTVDVVSFTHRGLGGHLVWSDHACDQLNQYFANADSPTLAREGNIHHGDLENRSWPMISHLGAMVSTVLGGTDSQRRKGLPAIGFSFFGDGSSSTGDIHESLNLASLLSLPILFVIENNGYAYSTPVHEQFAAGSELWKRAAGYGIEAEVVDCGDTSATIQALARAIGKVRLEKRPFLIEAHTLRLRGHAAYDTCDYLKPGESEGFWSRDPLARLRTQLIAQPGVEIDAVEHELSAFVENCISHCLKVGRPSPAGMEDDVYASPSPHEWVPSLSSAPGGAPESLTFAQAINKGLRKVLSERPESLILGQDIGTYGGAFKVTEGLLAEFGRGRVFNTPLAESACTGYAIGLGANGHRPIIEYQFADFCTEAATQITLNAATFHFRSGGQIPLVMRLPCGGGLTMGSFHSQELESTLLSMPGLKALYPSTAQDAFNAVLAAAEENSPVLLFEHKGLYRKGRQEVRWDPNFREVWKPRLVRPGEFATIVTYGEAVHIATEAAAYFGSEYERGLEVWDLRALSPLDLAPIIDSVSRTHRLIVLHEGRRTHGFGAEIVSRITESTFFQLEAAPLRIASLDLPVPFAPELEQAYRPTPQSVIEQIANWMG
ncbi:MAG: thiamine pyrophosphate-dependent enzyme [Opitutaceae bacterium]|nr:thiamine pyrophosphate-dependent enzyme [Opitutaceae bacterium]